MYWLGDAGEDVGDFVMDLFFFELLLTFIHRKLTTINKIKLVSFVPFVENFLTLVKLSNTCHLSHSFCMLSIDNLKERRLRLVPSAD